MPRPLLHQAPTPGELADLLAHVVAQRLSDALSERAEAGLIVPGGTTPGLLFDCLARQALAWSRVAVTLSDERLVAPDSPDSNAALVRARLLKGHAGEARFAPLALDDPTLSGFPWPGDVAVVGMGADGHTASWFPGAPQLHRALHSDETLVRVDPPDARHARLTLSAQRLCTSRYIAVLITGADKARVLDEALAGHDVAAMPIRAILACPQTEIFWAP